MKNILIVSGHPSLKKHSVSNKIIITDLQHHFAKAEFAFLDELYPEYKINVESEQAKLVNADIIVLQFPINWYHIPSRLACWIEQVFAYGFAYGQGGDKLKNKKLILSYTSGSPENSYSSTGYQQHNIQDFLLSIKQTAKLCNVDLVGHVYTGGMNPDLENATLMTAITNKSHEHAEKLIALIETIK